MLEQKKLYMVAVIVPEREPDVDNGAQGRDAITVIAPGLKYLTAVEARPEELIASKEACELLDGVARADILVAIQEVASSFPFAR